MQVLREVHKHCTTDDDFLLMKLDDFNKFHVHLKYVHNGKYQSPVTQGGGDPKRQKISQDRALASYTSDWPFNIGVIPTGQPNQTQSISILPLKQELHSPTYRNCGVSPSNNSSVYDLSYNNNSNDWLNAGCNKYLRHEAVPQSPSTTLWSSNPLYLPQTTIIDAAWAYSNHNF